LKKDHPQHQLRITRRRRRSMVRAKTERSRSGGKLTISMVPASRKRSRVRMVRDPGLDTANTPKGLRPDSQATYVSFSRTQY
jgi:hypothetical protein